MGADHSQKVKAPPIRSDYGSKDCVNLSSSTAVSRFNNHEPQRASPVIFNLSGDEQVQLENICERLVGVNLPLVMVCHGSNWKNKQLTPQALVEFLNLLQGHLNCYFVFIWGTETEKIEVQSLQSQFEQSLLLPRVSLPVLQQLMGMVDLIVAMDSLPLHLAATTTTSTFSIFGASLGLRFAPVGEQHRFFQGACPYGRSFTNRCPVLRTCPTGACIRTLSGKQIFENFTKQTSAS